MKRLKKIGLLVWFLLLIVPINLSAANYRQTFTNTPTRIIPAITDHSGNSMIPLETGGDNSPNPDSKTETNNNATTSVNQNDPQKSSIPVTDQNIKPVTKPTVVTSKTSETIKPGKETTGNTVHPLVEETAGQSTAHDLTKNNLKLENILTDISSWWLTNPLNLQIWYLFYLTGLVLYLFKLKQFRRPLLFFSVITLGFYLGSSLDPISVIFQILPKTNFTFDGALILLGIIIAISLFLGRFYCGWLCPLGAIQELIHPGTGTRVPPAMDKLLKYIKYLMLILFLYLAWRTGDNLWSKYEPLKVLVHFNGSALAVFVLILTLILSVIIERPFCRYICPLGAILAWTSRLALFKMRADAGACMVCGKCTSGDCPMNAIESFNTVTDLPEIDSAECIYCLRCQKICQRSALRVSAHRIDKMQNL
jgi:ferredoxin